VLSLPTRRPLALVCLLLLPVLLAVVPATAVPQGARSEPPARLLYVIREGDTYIASNVLFSRTDEFELAAQERVAEERRDNAVLIVATNRRLIGYSVYTASWVTLPLKAGERLEQLEAEDFSGFALTSRRIMNFNGRTGEWSESRR
jgi:hypothetical protein